MDSGAPRTDAERRDANLLAIEECRANRGVVLTLHVRTLRDVPECVGELEWLTELRLLEPKEFSIGDFFGDVRRFKEPIEVAGTSTWSGIVQRLVGLRVLVANGMRMMDADLQAIAALRDLWRLECAVNGLTTLEPLRALAHLKALNCSWTLISDLEPLRSLHALSALDCSGTRVSDLEPLRGLANFRELRCPATRVACFEPLRGLSALELLDCRETLFSDADLALLSELVNLSTLDLTDTAVSNLAPLRTLHKLSSLNLSCTQVSDLGPLSNLGCLSKLRFNGTAVSDLTPLRTLERLAVLVCGNSSVHDLSPLSELPNLAQLDASSTLVSSLEPLSKLENLAELDVSRTRVSSLRPLSNLRELTRLQFASTRVSDLAPLRNFRKLSVLEFSSTPVADLEPLRGLEHLSALSCSSSRISALTPLRSLRTLSKLSVDSTSVSDLNSLRELRNLSELSCASTRVSDLSPLDGLANLRTLDCSGTSISDLNPLRELSNLVGLRCANTMVSDLNPLCGLRSLRTLDCSATPVVSIEPLRGLRQLNTLDCSITPISDLDPVRELDKLVVLHCHGLGRLRDVPMELTQGECSAALKGYFRDLDAGAEQERRARVLLVGNGFAGKTTLAHCLIHGEPPSTPIVDRTHAIVSRKLELDRVEARVWDFAGQEIYHATHRLFLRASGLFVLLWTESDPQDSTPSAQRHSPAYWLDLIEWFGGGTIVVVKNKIDTLDRQADPAELSERSKQIKHRLKLSARSYTGVNVLRAVLQDELTALVEVRARRIGASWVRARSELAALPVKHLSRSEFEAIARAHDVVAPRALLTYLVNCGDAFYAPDAFGGRVFLDPSWVIDATYRMFAPGPNGPRRTLEQLQNGGEGTITGTQLKQIVWPEASEEEVGHYLEFVTGSEIVLEVGGDSRLDLAQRRFVIPALLPDITSSKLQQLRSHTAWELHIEFAFPLLHRALVERLLVRTASKNAERQWWRDTACWYDHSTRCTVLLDAQPAEAKIFLRVAVGRSGDASEALARLLLLLRESERQLPYQVRLSEDDESYASLDALEHALRTNSDVACGDAVISRERFAAVYDALGTPIPVLKHSGYGASDVRDAKREGSTTIIHNLTNYGSVNMATYNSKNTNSPFATTVQGDHSSAHVTAGTLSQDEHRQQIKRAQNALIEDQDSIEPAMYDVISKLLRLVREVQVEQKGLRSAQAEVKTLVDDVWAQATAKGMKPKPLSDTLEVVKQLASNPLTIEVAKKLIGS